MKRASDDKIDSLLTEVRFNSDGLIPAIIQSEYDGKVLMLAYMNAQSLTLTLETGYTHFYSRSRKRLWRKGEESGHVQEVREIALDCDKDSILVRVIQKDDTACHTGARSCFFNRVELCDDENSSGVSAETEKSSDMLDMLYRLILNRKAERPENSYVSYLFDEGQDKILKKIGEEAAELIIGSKNMDNEEIISEMADLWFHCTVVLGMHEIPPQQIIDKLKERHENMRR